MKVVNVVASFSLGKNISLIEIARRFWNVEYNPKKFGAVVLRQREPFSTFLIFNKGKIVSTGSKSIVDCFLSCKKLVRKMKKVFHVSVKMLDWKVQNVVASFKLPKKLNLWSVQENILNKSINLKNVETCYYNPESFSALQVKMPHKSILFFHTGRIILTGFVCPIELMETFNLIRRNFI